MNPFDLTPQQLKRAASIKEQIDELNKKLHALLGGPVRSEAAPKRKRTMSASAKKKIAATQKARWANLRRAKSSTDAIKPAAKAKKKRMSPAARAKLSAKLKAYWAAKKPGKK
jgi:truncated hemoglobin YjbI